MSEAMYAEGAAERALERMQKESPDDYNRMLALSLLMEKCKEGSEMYTKLNAQLEAIFDRYLEAPVVPANDSPEYKYVRGARVRVK